MDNAELPAAEGLAAAEAFTDNADYWKDRAERAEMERDDWRENFRSLDRAVAGDTGLSAMVVAAQAKLFKPRAERAEAMAENLAGAMMRLKDDMLERAELKIDAIGNRQKIVNCGNGAWIAFCQALAAYQAQKGAK